MWGEDENKQPTTTEVTLLRHDNLPYQNADKAFIEEFEKAQADIKVTPTTLRTPTCRRCCWPSSRAAP